MLAFFFVLFINRYLNFHILDIADRNFSPTLEAICKLLKLSDDVAGVTFLSLGNGAPDLGFKFFNNLSCYYWYQ
jgi:sodium/potassium/calcium exchanger 6